MKTYIAIDGPNFSNSLNKVPEMINQSKIIKHFEDLSDVVVAEWFTTPNTDTVRKLTDWMAYNGWRIISRFDHNGSPIKNMDIDIAVRVCKMATEFDEIVLGTGDSDFIPLVEHLLNEGKRVVLVGHIECTSSDLRKRCHQFIGLEDPYWNSKFRSDKA